MINISSVVTFFELHWWENEGFTLSYTENFFFVKNSVFEFLKNSLFGKKNVLKKKQTNKSGQE
jgi:hypothetical protein